MIPLQPLQLLPEYRDYVWGGRRLRPGVLTAEAWVVYEQNRVAFGPLAGCSLADVAGEYGVELLGRRAVQRTGNRFPLLVKLLDTAQWLSLQVHPNDEQAARLEGPGFFGKTEAVHVLEAAPGATMIAGLQPGTTAEALAEAVRGGMILDLARVLPVAAGDTLFVRPGMIHASGPGLLLYEVQQTSDLTYRVWDWNRPQTAGRVLHLDKSLAVADPTAVASAEPLPSLDDGDCRVLARCPFFTLEIVTAETRGVRLHTRGETFHALTVIEGTAQVTVGESSLVLGRFESVVVPAACGEYQLLPQGSFRALKAGV